MQRHLPRPSNASYDGRPVAHRCATSRAPTVSMPPPTPRAATLVAVVARPTNAENRHAESTVRWRQRLAAYQRHLEWSIPVPCETLLDVGCGAISPISGFRERLKWTVGVDAHAPSVARSKSLGIHDEYVVTDVLNIAAHFGPKSFDCVLASDVVEHLTKPDGFRLIRLMEEVARVRVLIFTPNGFMPQRAYDENARQEHLSGWEVSEMRRLGYRVIGINGWRPLRGERAALKWQPRPLWRAISFASRIFTGERPEHAFQILCSKDVGEPA